MEIKDVENLAELAKLELTETEKAQLQKDMEGILDYVKVIQEVDVPEAPVEYMKKNAWREDKLRGEKDFNSELITGQFPDAQDGFVKVKKIL